MKKLNIVLIIVILALLLAISGGFFDNGGIVVQTDTIMVSKTDTFWKDTTIIKEKTVEKKVVEIRRDTVFTPAGDTLQLITEHKTYQERLLSGKDTADVQVYTTGINTSVDSLKMRLMTHTEVVTNTVEITKIVEKKKTFKDRFHIGLQVGYGLGLKNKDFEPYVGIGGSFDL